VSVGVNKILEILFNIIQYNLTALLPANIGNYQTLHQKKSEYEFHNLLQTGLFWQFGPTPVSYSFGFISVWESKFWGVQYFYLLAAFLSVSMCVWPYKWV